MRPPFNMMGNNPIAQIMQMKRRGMSPEQVFGQMIKNNPNAQGFIDTMKNQANGRSVEELARQSAKQAGISEGELRQLFNTISRGR